jgi:hypothetical protein
LGSRTLQYGPAEATGPGPDFQDILAIQGFGRPTSGSEEAIFAAGQTGFRPVNLRFPERIPLLPEALGIVAWFANAGNSVHDRV